MSSHPSLLRRGAECVAISLFAAATVGCSRSPTIDILGSYFPSWLVCIGIAIVLTLLAHLYAARTGLTEQLWPAPIIYSALLCLFSCSLWLTLFG